MLPLATGVLAAWAILLLANGAGCAPRGELPTLPPVPLPASTEAKFMAASTATHVTQPTITVQAALPFSVTALVSGLQGDAYITDVCRYLRERWDPDRSTPGTVVVPVMFHTVFESGTYQPGDTFIPAADLERTVATARSLGFQTITSAQLADFLEHNARIPPRSMIWILDDRHPDVVDKYFMPIARDNHWTVTLGWIIGDSDHRRGLWAQMERLNNTGLLDVQSHGYAHYYAQDDTPEVMLRQELFGPIPILMQHFHQRPVAFVWPGGNFGTLSVRVAREAGYRLGFTVFSRGPLMYNCVPLGEPERAVGDPLMVLPRYWARPDLPEKLEQAAKLSDAAAAQALRDRAREEEISRRVCGCELPTAAAQTPR